MSDAQFAVILALLTLIAVKIGCSKEQVQGMIDEAMKVVKEKP